MDVLRRALGQKPRKEVGVRDELIDPEQRGMDVTYITPRILIVGRPTVRETSLVDRCINQKELAKFLEQKFDQSYMLFNLSSKDRNQIDYALFGNQVIEFAPGNRGDVTDDTPNIGMVFRFVHCMKFWMEWDSATVAVLFCNTSETRSAFFLSSYLVYSGVHPTMESALRAIGEQRTGDPTSMRSGLWPSWVRMVSSVDRLVKAEPCLPSIHALSHIILSAPELRAYLSGHEDIGGGTRYPVLQLFHGPKVVWDSARDCEPDETMRWEDDKLVAEVLIPGQRSGSTELVLCGDFQLWVSLPRQHRGWASRASSSPTGGGTRPGLTDIGVKSIDTVDGRMGMGHLDPSAKTTDVRLLVGRWVFHTNNIEQGVTTLTTAELDVFRPTLTPGLQLNLILGPVPPETVACTNLDRLMRRSFINLPGMRALQQGANDFSSRHYVFPDTQHLKQLTKEGIDATAACCALQRANNAMGRAREALDCPSMKDIFKEAQAMRDLQMIRATLTMDEIAGVLAARANMAVKKRGLQISDLDFSGLLAAAQLGNVSADGKGGKGKGGGGKGGAGRHRKHKKKKGKKDSSEDDDSEGSGSGGRSSGSAETAEEDAAEEKAKAAEDDLAALLGKNDPAGKLFEGDTAAKDGENEDEEEEVVEEEGGEDWLMKDHPIFGKWFKSLSDGSKTKAALLEELAKEQWNPGLLDADPNGVVPDVPASTVPLKDWEFMQQYTKMAKVGLPRQMVEHKMNRDFVNPALLDANPDAVPSAQLITPAKKGGPKKPSIIRKKLHWVPIKGKVESTIWGGPPGDLVAAAAQLITDEVEFTKLFIQNPDDLKKKKKKDADGLVQLLDHKRAMNCGIALAKLHMAYPAVVECLTRMSARTKDGKGLLTGEELANLVTLSPTDEEVTLVKGYKGDVARLGPAEKFFLAVAEVPACRGRAAGLAYQFDFDDRLRASRARIQTFTAAIDQLKGATRFQRLLKAVLVLGNKMNGIDASHRKGTVKAFTVASLHQLYLTKTFDPTISVMQFLFRLLRRVDPDLLRLGRDFPNSGAALGEAARLPLDTLSGDVKELREGLTALEGTVKAAVEAAGGLAALLGGDSHEGGAQYIEELIEMDKADSSSSDSKDEGAEEGDTDKPKKRKRKVRKVKRRVEPLPIFASLAQAELASLSAQFEAAVSSYKAIIGWFKEDPELAADDLFGSLRIFLQTWETQLKLLADKKRKEKEAKSRAKAARKRKEEIERQREEAARSDGGSGSTGSTDSDSESGSSSGSSSGSRTESTGIVKGKTAPGGSPARVPQGLSMSGKGGPPPAPRKSKSRAPSSATSATVDSSDYEPGSSSSSKAAGAGRPTAAWATALGEAGAGGVGEDEDEEDEGAPAGNPMGGLFAAIKAKGAGGGGGSPAPTPGALAKAASGTSFASDPRSGLLGAIRAKAEKGGGLPGKSPASSPAPLADAIKRTGSAASIRGSATTASAGTGAGGPKGGSPSTDGQVERKGPAAKDPEGWKVGKDEADDPEAGGRNALLEAILKKRGK